MMRGLKTCALGLAVLAGLTCLLAGGAAAQTIEARPETVNVPATRSATVPVTWEITNTLPDIDLLSITSNNALLAFSGPNGSATLQISTPVIRNVPLGPGQTARLRETMVIPQSFLMQALQAGTRTIGVLRLFEIEIAPGAPQTLEGVMTVNLTGSLGGEVQISRIDLRFQNEAVQIIVPQHHGPEVHVDLTYTGTGLFRAVWELADPRVTAVGGSLIFRILRQDRIRLGIGGSTRIKGPALPADLTGLHVVRFRVLDGPLAGEAPIVRYFVKAASPGGDDWWKRYIRPHNEGEGMVRVPTDTDEDEVIVEEPEEDSGGEDEPPQE